MGWLRTILLGDIGNRLDIEDTETEIKTVKHQQRRTSSLLKGTSSKVETLQNEVEKQKLAIQALTRFLIEKNLVAEAELYEFIQLVDAEDGVVDGKLSLNPSTRKLNYD